MSQGVIDILTSNIDSLWVINCSILVFIIAIGYYITTALVGGNSGTFISKRIPYHVSSSLNWGLGAALGVILLGIVLALFVLYDRIVGIDNMKLG